MLYIGRTILKIYDVDIKVFLFLGGYYYKLVLVRRVEFLLLEEGSKIDNYCIRTTLSKYNIFN